MNLFGTLIKQNTEGVDERNMKLVQSILSYIEKNYAGDLSMDDLTEKFHVSRTYISRLLKKYAGKSFSGISDRYSVPTGGEIDCR